MRTNIGDKRKNVDEKNGDAARHGLGVFSDVSPSKRARAYLTAVGAFW